MADKKFGVKQIDLIGASGTPKIESPNNLNINAVTVAISTDVTIGGQVTSNIIVGTGKSVGIGTTNPTSALTVVGSGASISQLFVTGVSTFAGITTVTGPTLFAKQLNVSGVSTFAGGITTVTGSTLFTKQLNVSGISTFSGSYLYANYISLSAGYSLYVNNSGGTYHQLGGTNSDLLLFKSRGIGPISDTSINILNDTLNTGGGSDESVFKVYGDGGLRSYYHTISGGVAIQSERFSVTGGDSSGATPSNIIMKVGTGFTASGNGSVFANQLNVTGVSTFAGITTVTGSTLFAKQLSVSGVSTFAGPTLFAKQLNVSGVSTFTNIQNTGITSTKDLIVSGTGNDVGSAATISLRSRNNFIDFDAAIPFTSPPQQFGIKFQGTTILGGSYAFPDGSIFLNNYNGTTALSINNNGLTLSGITTVTGSTLFAKQLNVSGVSTFQGYLGVGATTNPPAYTLDVAGYAKIRDGLIVNGGSTYPVELFADLFIGGYNLDIVGGGNLTVGGNVNVSGVSTSGTLNVGTGGTVINATAEGLVGIGTTNPTSKLTVQGDVSVSGVSTFAGITTVTGSTLFAKQLSVSGFTSFTGPVRFYDTLNNATDFIQYQADRFIFRNNQSLSMGNGQQFNLSNDGTTTLLLNAGPLIIRNNSVSGVTSITGNTVGTIADFTQDGEVRIPGKLQIGVGGTVITTTSAGLVGIGTTNPTNKLTVKGNTYLEGTTTSAGLLRIADANGAYGGTIDGSSTTPLTFTHLSDNPEIRFRTQTPSAGGVDRLTITQETATFSSHIITGNGLNITCGGFVSAASTLSVGVGGTVITTTTAGLVGIGTTNPTSKLTVQGNVSISGVVTASSFVGDGSGLTNLPGGGGAVNNGTLTLAVSGTGLSGSQTFTANQSSNATFTVTSNATSSNTASTLVARDGSGDFTAGTINATSFRTNTTTGNGTDVGFAIKYYITSSGASAYRFAGPGVLNSTDNPTLYLHRGFTYIFENSTGGSHPFAIRTSSGGPLYTSAFLSGSQSGTQIFTVPFDAPSTLVYQCIFHGGMVGTLNIVT